MFTYSVLYLVIVGVFMFLLTYFTGRVQDIQWFHKSLWNQIIGCVVYLASLACFWVFVFYGEPGRFQVKKICACTSGGQIVSSSYDNGNYVGVCKGTDGKFFIVEVGK